MLWTDELNNLAKSLNVCLENKRSGTLKEHFSFCQAWGGCFMSGVVWQPLAD